MVAPADPLMCVIPGKKQNNNNKTHTQKPTKPRGEFVL